MFKPGQSGNPGGKRDPRTARARMAIAKFVDENADRLQEWLDAIAAKDGPKAAFQCFTDIIEYNIPKLARTEHTGENGGPVVHKIERAIVRSEHEHQWVADGDYKRCQCGATRKS